ncbi:hydrogen peroxide-dependent heme synthase [Glycomyces mayteni]|uniref:Coproheme decarboxylase n=1 Tax=Glycomyces mayteni TaxID=543887 RepID=A0ABW2D641_9ACTN|nr:chlorite dismutase family protein [Glycomyces mayteni]
MTERQSNNPNAARIKELNDTIRYTLWSVFRAEEPMPSIRQDLASDMEAFFKKHCGDQGVTVRGTYDLTGMRADADLMVWWHAESSDDLQKAYSDFRRSPLGRHLAPVWSNMALHRPAEFNRSHLPAFLTEEPRGYVSVYPFVRSYEWYLLPDEERRDLLREHGQMARDFPDVRANTVPAFSLGDYEWILAFEADELHRIVDLMRELRASGARRHVREEIPFFTGKRRTITDIINDLP